jgi:hypothetical protein
MIIEVRLTEIYLSDNDEGYEYYVKDLTIIVWLCTILVISLKKLGF